MDIVAELNRAVEQLLGRSSGPLHFRLVLQPIVASILAIRAGLKDAREGQPAFLWTLVTNAAERKREAQSGWNDLRGIFIVAVVLDVLYQLIVLRRLYPIQTLVVAVVVAVLPYVLFRGAVTRVARRFYPRQVGERSGS